MLCLINCKIMILFGTCAADLKENTNAEEHQHFGMGVLL